MAASAYALAARWILETSARLSEERVPSSSCSSSRSARFEETLRDSLVAEGHDEAFCLLAAGAITAAPPSATREATRLQPGSGGGFKRVIGGAAASQSRLSRETGESRT
jgi:hypothetical protein